MSFPILLLQIIANVVAVKDSAENNMTKEIPSASPRYTFLNNG